MEKDLKTAEKIMFGVQKNTDYPPNPNRAGYLEPMDRSWRIDIGWDGKPSLALDPKKIKMTAEAYLALLGTLTDIWNAMDSEEQSKVGGAKACPQSSS